MKVPRTFASQLRAISPRVGHAGTRASRLHASGADDAELFNVPDPRFDAPVEKTTRFKYESVDQLRAMFVLRWLGTVGALLVSFGGLGAGALPVVGDPYDNIRIFALPLGSILAQLLQTSSAIVFLGVGLMALAWLGMAKFVGTPLPQLNPPAAVPRPQLRKRAIKKAHSPKAVPVKPRRVVSVDQIWRTWFSWVIPLIPTAPLFTQDIYSYLANGSIVRQGLDPYSAGPVQLLGIDNQLARSVPFIWANSPSPYGPVSLQIAETISLITGDTIISGVILHRLVSILGVIAAGWAITKLAGRCRISAPAALWLGLLNPLAILHLIAGIHNESIMLGFLLVGMELALQGVDKLTARQGVSWIPAFLGSGVIISCAGMVKVTGFIGLGFAGMALARALWVHRGVGPVSAVIRAAAWQSVVLVSTVAAVTVATGISLGWVTGQGGAASIRSWLSISTDIGVIFGYIGMALGLGDHTESMLTITRAAGLLVAAAFIVRMLLATFRGSIHPVGGLGVATLIMVMFFPVVHPWYILWAVFPLAAWANRFVFRACVVAYSVPMSVAVLPRGLGLPPDTVLVIYLAAALTFLPVAGVWWVALRRQGISALDW
ncbi:alpha 1,6 mannopyranosyltransferase [Corynebacterium phocae]|uniref:Alpha 1,6 mannopyranosyltransferase n=1 Tax=Corynebacterium phocae TaxID=161895 RepID=A0A1L7D2V1_9CORY|nr:polyprenol phosphomannose-dependent alpha 1,6 mannosyltransferase MptB [Corynebacterium phocae]APT92496.1 alpha 1,6 mannopyranosyltransferase [Corynebacterium phocae]KAA8725202.1 alpha 1,6 mannopyranosyltransferase [Corynebacterium phocae]